MTNIRVALRVRPMSQRELDGDHPVVVAVENNSAFITDIRVPERPSADSRQRFRHFDFDHTFWFSNNGLQGAASQQRVYTEMGPHLEKAIMAGYNACLLAYGQSGTGKTHTMLGTKEDPGIIPRLCHSLWDKLKVAHPPMTNGKPSFRMEVSFLEIYREKVRDLLDPDKSLKLREHPQLGPHVQGLTRLEVTGEISLLDLLWEGERRRASGNTSSNRRSSRSHAIWTLYLTVYNTIATSKSTSHVPTASTTSSAKSRTSRGSCGGSELKRSHTTGGVQDNTRLITNQVHLVDLAGSEKADCTTAKSLLAEGADINRSLVALGNVISALAEKAQFVPYRDSALTWLLKDSIGGNASTSIIITASPSSHCHAQTLNSLRFAQRARLVENTPKINLSSPSPNSFGPYGYLSVMSAMELKKDISRLAKIIKTAQTNGGILKGLAPKAGWTRLIHAIEGINDAERQQVKLQRERAGSEDTTGSSPQPSTSSTLTGAKSLNDVMVQANMEKRNPVFRRRPSRQSDTSLQTYSTPPQSPTKIIGTEVFIPTSSSYKCLTWQQEETHQVPKPISSSTSSLSEEDPSATTPLQSAASNPQINHMKYMVPVHYPTTHNLDHASRISEKIHGTVHDENYEQLVPMEVKDSYQCPVVHGKIPTLVNSVELPTIDEISDTVTDHLDMIDKQSIEKNSVKVAFIAKQGQDYLFPVKCKHFASAQVGMSLAISPFESSDEHEFNEPEPLDAGKRYRAIRSKFSETLQKSLQEDDYNEGTTFEDTCYFTAGESVLSQMPTMLISSSSSYESINMPATVRPVNLIREFSKTSDFTEDFVEDLVLDNEVFHEDYEPPVANICMVAGQALESAIPLEVLLTEPSALDSVNYFNPINGVSDSKFRNYFAKELHQMDRMGKQIKSLLQLTQRYNVVKPFLDEISNLHNSDHSKPDPKLDAHIESCSGWNVDIELDKVHQEIHSLNKVLKTGLGSAGIANQGNGGKHYSKGSTTSNEGVTSDSSVDIGDFTSFAHMRQIPLLSSTKESDEMMHRHHAFNKRVGATAPAKVSVSQPIMSSSSNNGSVSSSAQISTGDPFTYEDRGNNNVNYFTPNFYSTPKRKQWKKPGMSDAEESYGSSFLPPLPPHPHVNVFRPHPSTSRSNSTETFYRNPVVNNDSSVRLQYCPSNSSSISNMSSSTSVLLDSNPYSESGGYPLNISHSEPRRVAGGAQVKGHPGHGHWKGSESSTNFLAHHDNIFVEDIRNIRHGYDNTGSSSATLPSGGSSYSSVSKDMESWNTARAHNSRLNNFQRLGAGEQPELSGYPNMFHHHHERSTSDSLDLCSYEDSKYGNGAHLSNLEKSTSRSQFSSFGGSTTETSEYCVRGPRPVVNSSSSSGYPSHRHANNSSDSFGLLRSTMRSPHVYKPRINRNDQF